MVVYANGDVEMKPNKQDIENAKELKIEKMDGTDLIRVYWTSSPMRKWYSLYKRIPSEEN